MSEQSKLVPISLRLDVPADLNQEQLDALIKELTSQVQSLGVGTVEVKKNESPPPGSKVVETFAASLALSVLPGLLPKLLDITYNWLSSRQQQNVRVKTEIDNRPILLQPNMNASDRLSIQNIVAAISASPEAGTGKPGGRYALIIGNTEYDEPALARLASPEVDVAELAGILRSPNLGGFDDVTTLVNQNTAKVNIEIERFFKKRSKDDLLLLYFSGHGIQGDHGELYLAMKDTNRDYLRSTAVLSAFINQVMDGSLSQRQILILDCCYSGSFMHGAKASNALGSRIGTGTAFEGNGFGKVVLTATDMMEYAWEGDQVFGEATNSVFTRYLIQGLKNGDADTDCDGWVSLDELYDYVYSQILLNNPKQTPSKWSFHQRGQILLAKNLHPKMAELPADLLQAIESPYPSIRSGSVQELGNLLHNKNKGLARAAYSKLHELTKDDSRSVSIAAAGVLASFQPDWADIPQHPPVQSDGAPKGDVAPAPPVPVPTPTPAPVVIAPAKPPSTAGKIREISTLGFRVLASGLANLMIGIALTTPMSFFFIPFALVELVTSGLLLFGERRGRGWRNYLRGVAVIEIASILNINPISMVLGIFNLRLINGKPVQTYWQVSDKGK